MKLYYIPLNSNENHMDTFFTKNSQNMSSMYLTYKHRSNKK